MRQIRTIAFDKDGTLVEGKSLTPAVQHALDLFKTAGGNLLLVTGETIEQLDDFSDLHRFDLVIAENGAVLYWPISRESKILTSKRSDDLLELLGERQIADTVGDVIVSAKPPRSEQLASMVARFSADWNVIRNRDKVMILPKGTDKATGLRSALNELKVSMSHVVAVGDGQNDACMLKAAGIGVTLVSADQIAKKAADIILDKKPGDVVLEVIDQVLTGHWE